jgi:hypothetical protein
MDEGVIREWFDQYLTTLAARGRGESDDLEAVLDYYGVPLLVTADGGALALTGPDDVLAFARQQIDGMRAANYDHSETLESEVTPLNSTSALYRAHFARKRADGGEIGRFGATYLIIDGPAGPRISATALHAPGR